MYRIMILSLKFCLLKFAHKPFHVWGYSRHPGKGRDIAFLDVGSLHGIPRDVVPSE